MSMTTAVDAKGYTRHKKGQPASMGGKFAEHERDDANDVVLATPTDAAEESVFRRRYDTAEDKIKAFMGELDAAREALDTDEEWLAYLDVMTKFHHYSANNQMLIWLQRPDATRVAGFKKWQEMGRQVRKGEKGIAILAPRRANVEVRDGAGKPILDENGKPRKEMRVIGVTTATVFDISQTDGPDLPDPHRMPSEAPPEGFIEDLEASIRAAGFTIDYEPMMGGKRGYTTSDGSKRVAVREGMSPTEVARTLAHERAHIAAGHLDRVGEYHTGEDGHRGQMEVEADSIAYVMLRSNGMTPEVVGTSAAYTKGWARTDKDALKGTMDVVSKAVQELLGSGAFRNAS